MRGSELGWLTCVGESDAEVGYQENCFVMVGGVPEGLFEFDSGEVCSSVRVVPVGAAPDDPRMMVKLLLFAYSSGVTSSRELERRCRHDVALRWLSEDQLPDYRSLARLGRVASDWRELTASASRHKVMSYERVGPRIEQFQVGVRKSLRVGEVLPVLYLHGLSTTDFAPTLEQFLHRIWR